MPNSMVDGRHAPISSIPLTSVRVSRLFFYSRSVLLQLPAPSEEKPAERKEDQHAPRALTDEAQNLKVKAIRVEAKEVASRKEHRQGAESRERPVDRAGTAQRL